MYDYRYEALPQENYLENLYLRYPRMMQQEYRAAKRDLPTTLARHYPENDPGPKPAGFHGRNYYEYGPVPFKYSSAYKDNQWWLERDPYVPRFPNTTSQSREPMVSYMSEVPRAKEVVRCRDDLTNHIHHKYKH